MDARLAKHFLRRLRHRLEADAIDHAVERGILVERLGTVEGRRLRGFAPGPLAIGKSEAEIAILLGRHHRAGSSTARSDDDWADFGVTADDKGAEGFTSGSDQVPVTPENALDLLRLIRQSAEPPRPEAIASLLLVAQAITMSETSLDEVMRMLRTPRPIVRIVGRVPGFEQAFLDLLEGGLILPGGVATCPGYGLNRNASNIGFSAVSAARWRRMVVFSGSDRDDASDEAAERQVGSAGRTAYPILGVADSEDFLPPSLMRAATINLICGPLTMQIIRKTMSAVLGDEPEGGIPWQYCEALTIADLALAIRPGVPVGRVLNVLEDMARARFAAASVTSGSGSGSGGESSSKPKDSTKKSDRGDPSSGSERIEPVEATGPDKGRFVPRVETLSGYGDATAWALGLKADLALWRAGKLAWQDMSAKLILSGPPGIGKTTFARALCNSLRIPLFATSVATWLEPGYLGDVLKRMTLAFREAEAAAPAVLFIDEIDGFGTRTSGKDWSDYHNAIVNRALELLDGAARTAGVVVVGATNRPEGIDPAILRAGRLETHIVIPRPDTAALIGILRHHLGGDLDAVVASAPPETFGEIMEADTPLTSLNETDPDSADGDPSSLEPATLAPNKTVPDTHGDGRPSTRSEAASLGPVEEAYDDTV
ncbi:MULTISPECIES: ATP-binding protein [unclassified Mesorhizobium]|uniref:AAA family ATPase n=1 Tax=unclassified Mesorhizobium TaxID=325217 RepID=UPI0015E2EFCF|nr:MULTISPECIES: ATP-binding protein [unclassified Mesorhizobium]